MLRAAALALTILTGFTGLAYEITWQKYLGILLGAQSEATAAILALFLGGLSLGYWLFGVLTRRVVARETSSARSAPLLAVYAVVEAGIGAWALAFPWFFASALSISVRLPTGVGGTPFAFDMILAAALIVPPAVLMGGTIPILTQSLARSLADATRVHALVYSLNTAGAFVGALGSGFWLIPWLGLEGVLRAMGVINLGVGVSFALLGRSQRTALLFESGETERRDAPSTAIYASAALFVGFAMMAVQTVLVRIGGLAFGSSEFTFSMVVAVFVLCIALGSFLVARLPRIGRWLLPTQLWLLLLLLGVLYLPLEAAPYWAHVLRTLFRDQEAAFYPYHAAAFVGILIAIGPAVVLSGTTLPLLFHALRREFGDLGAQAGRLYGANTLGSLIGAVVGGYLLLFWLDLCHVYQVAMGAVALSAALVTARLYPRIAYLGAPALFLASVLAIDLLPAWRPQMLMAGVFRQRQPAPWSYRGPSELPSLKREFRFYDDDPTSSVAVTEDHANGKLGRAIVVNGKSDGHTTGDLATMAMAALVPALFAERAERAFVIGYGTGISAGELAELDEMRSVTVVEISPAVVQAAPLFDFANHGASGHPKVRIVRTDAYRALLKAGERFDVIVSEPSNPWVSGVEMLFSREFLEVARDRLTPNGVYAQWYHLYETDAETVALVLRTYAAVFDHISVWGTLGPDLLLLGFRNQANAIDLERLERRAQREDFREGLARLGIRGLPDLLVHETLPLGVVHAAGLKGLLHELYHPRLSFLAGRAFFRGRRGELPFTGFGTPAQIGRENSLLGRYLARFDGSIPPETRQSMTEHAIEYELQVGPALLADWARAEPRSSALRKQIAGIRSTRGHDWVSSLPQMRGFLGDPTPGAEESVSPATALRATARFGHFYSHALPFEPAALVSLWERCNESNGGGAPGTCRRGLHAARLLASGSPLTGNLLEPTEPEAASEGAGRRPPPDTETRP